MQHKIATANDFVCLLNFGPANRIRICGVLEAQSLRKFQTQRVNEASTQ